jgi:hypothetical protein
MFFGVSDPVNDLKVLKPVVGLSSVDVVNKFGAKQLPP